MVRSDIFPRIFHPILLENLTPKTHTFTLVRKGLLHLEEQGVAIATMASFRDKRPAEIAEPRRRPRSPIDPNAEGMDYGSEAASKYEPSQRNDVHVPVAYPVAQVVAPAAEGVGGSRVEFELSEESSEEDDETSQFGQSQFAHSEFSESQQGTEYSLYGSSELAGEGEGRGSNRRVGTREWARQQQSQNSSQFTVDENPWDGPGRQESSRGGFGKDRRQHDALEDGRIHDLPQMPHKKQPSNHSVLSHDLSGFSDFDPVPKHGGAAITAPHPAPSDRSNWNRGLTGAAAAAADADAHNLARQMQLEREAADRAQRRAALRAEDGGFGEEPSASGGRKPKPPAPHSGFDGIGRGGRHDGRGGDGAAVRDIGDMKEEDGRVRGMSAFRVSMLEAQRTHGDPYDERSRNDNGTIGEHALGYHHALIFTPLMFLICLIFLVWEFHKNSWDAEPVSDNPSYGPSVDTLIACGAKRTDLIVENGDWWRLISPMFLHAGVVHFLFNMFGFIQVGAMVERSFGWWRIGAIYLVAGVYGTIVSAIFVPTQVMVGASGAIFGVFGALWSDLWQNWSIIADRCQRFTMLFILTAVNVILGLMPFLDNFAHCGGMLMGFFMGLGLLVEKRQDDFGDRLNKKCYQKTLQLVAAIAVPTLFILGLSLLYGRSDPSEWCGWCEKISCVEFPPGDPWWGCDECSISGFEVAVDSAGLVTITCPDETTESSDQCSTETDDDLLQCCKTLCLS